MGKKRNTKKTNPTLNKKKTKKKGIQKKKKKTIQHAKLKKKKKKQSNMQKITVKSYVQRLKRIASTNHWAVHEPTKK